MASAARKTIKDLIEEDKLPEAERQAAAKLDAFRSQGDEAGIATMLLMKAEAALAGMKASTALKAAREAWPLAKNLDKKLQAEILLITVNALNMSGQSKEAIRAATSSLAAAAEAKEPSLEAGIQHALAVAHLNLDSGDDALEAEQKALDLYRGAKDKKGEALSMTTMAKAQRVAGRFDQAITTAKQAAALWRSLGQAAGIAAAVDTICVAQAAQGYPKAALQAAEEELSLLQKAGVNTKNELIMMEKVAQVAKDQGQILEALRAMEDMIKVCKKANDKVGEARRTMQAAEVHAEQNHSQDALRLAREAQELFQAQAMNREAEEAKKFQTQIFVNKDQHSKAPHRSDAILALKSFVRAVELRETDDLKKLEDDLNKAASAIKDSEMSTALESLFERDPAAIPFLEKQGWDLASFKVPTNIYQYPHKAFYLKSVYGGMNFGPQFRAVYPYKAAASPGSKGKASALAVAQLPDTEAWQGQLMFRHGVFDAGMQSSGVMNFPP